MARLDITLKKHFYCCQCESLFWHVSSFTFQVESRLPRSDKLKTMVKTGIPHSIRPHIWLRVSGALEKKNKSDTSYKDIVKASSNDLLMTSKQIEKVSPGVAFQQCVSLEAWALHWLQTLSVLCPWRLTWFQDLLRTMPSNACFCNINSTGVPRLRRVLRGMAWLYPDIGYCQGTGMVGVQLPGGQHHSHDIVLFQCHT